MPTIITHSVFALLLGRIFQLANMPKRFWLLAVACTMLPDLDVIGFSIGIAYGDPLGHRGFSHSLVFALLVSICVVAIAFRQPEFRPLRLHLLVFYFLVTASHGLFDAMTNGGLGIAFFAPFDDTRYFLPFRPIQVSPIGLADFIRWGGMRVLIREWVWIILPTVMVLAFFSITRLIRKKFSHTDR